MTAIVIESDVHFGLLTIAVAVGLSALWLAADAIGTKIRRRRRGDR